jgi:hypothetical protein
MKTMKKICFCLFISLVIFSCKKETTDSSPNSSITSISGKIVDWPYGSDKTLKAGFYVVGSNLELFVTIDTCSIDNDGNFNLTSLAVPPGIYLISLDSFMNGSSYSKTNFDISNHVTKTLDYYLGFFIFSKESSRFITSIYKAYHNRFDSSTAEYYNIEYMYVDRDVSIKGSRSESNPYNTVIKNANLNFKAGWNKIVIKEVYSKDSSTIDFSGNEPAEAIWKTAEIINK